MKLFAVCTLINAVQVANAFDCGPSGGQQLSLSRNQDLVIRPHTSPRDFAPIIVTFIANTASLTTDGHHTQSKERAIFSSRRPAYSMMRMNMKGSGGKNGFDRMKSFFRSGIQRNILPGIFSISCFAGSGCDYSIWAHAVASMSNNAVITKTAKKRILILLSDTGGGHKASAKAIETALDLLYPGMFTCEIADIWTDHSPYPFNTFVSSYQWAAKNPWAWRLLYWYGLFPPTRWFTQEWSRIACHGSFQAYIEGYRPDAVVSVHPLCQDLPLRILNKMGGGTRKIPFVTVVTDLGGAHPTWFHKGVDKCFVPSDAVANIALAHGLAPSQIEKHGLPVRRGFWDAGRKRSTNLEIRQQLGLKNLPTVLVVGGGDGVGGLSKTAISVGQSLAKLDKPCQMVVVCGKNEKVRAELQRTQWGENLHVVVNGFVSNMDDWMIASDCLVTKAGPGTIAEAAIVGLPTMLSSFLPGQEAGNVPYVIESGFGDYDANPKRLAEKVSTLLADDVKLKQFSERASVIGQVHSSATKEIAKEIARLVLTSSPVPA